MCWRCVSLVQQKIFQILQYIILMVIVANFIVFETVTNKASSDYFPQVSSIWAFMS
jgi:hypothetical protein